VLAALRGHQVSFYTTVGVWVPLLNEDWIPQG